MKIESITLKNFLIIPHADIELTGGLNVVTGETGSGKSLFVSAIRLLRGERASRSIVGKWGERGEVTAVVVLDEYDERIRQQLHDLSIEPDEGSVIVRRVIGTRNLCYLNGTPVNLTTLEDLFGAVVEISSQFENQEVRKKEYQVSVLDSFSTERSLLVAYGDLYSRIRELEKNRQELEQSDDPARREFLKFQIDELNDLDPQEGELDELEKKIELLENRFQIAQYVGDAESRFMQASEILLEAERSLRKLNEIEMCEESVARVSSMLIELDDMGKSLAPLRVDEFSEIDEDSVRERYDRINRIMLKHGALSSSELLEKFRQMEEELCFLESVPQRIDVLENEIGGLKREALDLAGKIGEMRRAGAPVLCEKIEGYLRKLGMGSVRFTIDIKETDDITPNGIDRVEFLINTTGSDRFGSLSTLSGGELSRLLLTLKLIDNQKGKFILFDEIDSNIGGEIASVAAGELKINSRNNQILVVTHFPQTAARGDAHLVVEKGDGDDGVSSRLRRLEHTEKVRELARMMGDSSSDEHLVAAEKLLGSEL